MELQIKKDSLKNPTNEIQKVGPTNKNEDKTGSLIPSVWLSAEQVEEINLSENSLKLFYATRVEPLSLEQIQKLLPEATNDSLKQIVDRFLVAGIIELNNEKYFSKFPNNFINYSNTKYDAHIESEKDYKIFNLMKETAGNREFWEDKSYFSIDEFYSKEQTAELQQMFDQIRFKAKQFANDNKKTSIKDKFFRRIKFYDMTWVLFLFLLCSFGKLSQGTAGNDPKGMMAKSVTTVALKEITFGNDPKGRWIVAPMPSLEAIQNGNVPLKTVSMDANGCGVAIGNRLLQGNSPEICKLSKLVQISQDCSLIGENLCKQTVNEITNTLNTMAN